MMKRVCIVYAGVGVLLWPVPLLNVLQAESAALVAFVSFFVAGGPATRAFAERGDALVGVWARHEAALLVPLAMLLVAQLWAPNCTLRQGLLFYVLFPGVTVLFAVALAYFLAGTSLRRPGLAHALLGGAIVLAGPVYDLGLHPQFYTYNHVFGGILGPIYDEQLAVRPGLFVFRGLTLLWAGAAVFAGRLLRGYGGWGGVLLCLLVIGGAYTYADRLGINTSASAIQAALGGHHRTSHFDLYYDPSRLDSAAVAALADDHEAYYADLQKRLGGGEIQETGRIQSYLYPNPDVKGRLTGARTTSVAPVWLGTPQVHLLSRRAASTLGHELAHIAARPYGLPLLKASWAPGLVEGWAVALEPPDGSPSPHDMMNVARATGAGSGAAGPDALVRRLSPWGFWTGRGAVSYTATGSFVQYLLQTHGPERLKRVYAWGDFESVYGRPLRRLAEDWISFLQRRPVVSRAAHEVVIRRFTKPSLFEADCPHHVPPPRRHVQAARRALQGGDTTRAARALHRALQAAPRYQTAHIDLARVRLARDSAATVRRQLDTLSVDDPSSSLSRLRGDAHVLTGSPETARVHYAAALAKTPRHLHDQRARLMLRDATVQRPEILQILVSGDSAHVQAHRLADLPQGTVGAAWRAVRLFDARRYEAAAAQWAQVGDPLAPGRPRAWHQSWTVQRTAWGAEAAVRAGQPAQARRLATAGARRAEALGAGDWARALRTWSVRAAEVPPSPGAVSASEDQSPEPRGSCPVQ